MLTVDYTKMKKLRIEPGCITCGLCEFVAPEVFEVTDISYVKPNADILKNNDAIEEAVRGCPVAVIVWDTNKKDDNGQK